MLQDGYVLDTKLRPYLLKIGGSKQDAQEFCQRMKTKYNLPIQITTDILYGNKASSDYNELIQYWFTIELAPDIAPQFFSNKAITTYSKLVYEEKEPVLPLSLPMVPVATDQWIGVISIHKLMELRSAGLLHYNAETQRALRVMVKGEEVIFKPYLNETAVRRIYENVQDGYYIPNTITLNIEPTDKFDCQNGVMRLEEVGRFDIVDGYHRLKAFERSYDRDNSFDMNVELRIICFSVDKAKRFIYQEDQKTKMRRVDSEAFNYKSTANDFLQELNKTIEVPQLRGKINTTDGFIRFGVAAKAVGKNLPKTKLTSSERILWIRRYTELLKEVIAQKPELGERRWTDYEVRTVFENVGEPIDDIIASLGMGR